jgi:uncharacterized membrane protein
MEYIQLILRNLLPLVFYLVIQYKIPTQQIEVRPYCRSWIWFAGCILGLLWTIVWNQVPIIHEIATGIYIFATLSVLLLMLPVTNSSRRITALFEFFFVLILTRNLLSQVYQVGFGISGTLTDEVVIDICFIFISIILLGFIYYALSKIKEQIFTNLFLKRRHLWLIGILLPVQFYWLTEGLLNWMMSGYWDPSSSALRLVSQMKFISPVLAYLELIVIGTYVAQAFFHKKTTCTDSDSIKVRLQYSQRLRIKRNQTMGVVCLFIVLAPMLYWDLIGSQPPKLTASTELLFGEDENIHLQADITSDDDLHRFIVRFPDKKIARFFVVNKEIARLSPVVLLDACLICGPSGYIKKGNYLVCLSCHNKIFRPSLGRYGGCNPIPLRYQIKYGEILITKADLLLATNHFKSEAD